MVNYECGAEFVQKDIQYPTDYDLNNPLIKGCSFDGDADRLIYFRRRTGKNKRIDVIDGDKQFALIMMYVRELLEQTGLEVPHVLVNTAYSNGMANKYLD